MLLTLLSVRVRIYRAPFFIGPIICPLQVELHSQVGAWLQSLEGKATEKSVSPPFVKGKNHDPEHRSQFFPGRWNGEGFEWKNVHPNGYVFVASISAISSWVSCWCSSPKAWWSQFAHVFLGGRVDTADSNHQRKAVDTAVYPGAAVV